MNYLRKACVALVALAALVPAGCGNIQKAAARQRAANDLKQIGLLYHNYHDQHRKGPSGPNDPAFVKMAGEFGGQPVLAKVQSGEVVLFWDVNFSDLAKGAGTAETVLGYEKDVPTAGGLVLMADATVKTMTAAEFNAAPKANHEGK
jgi:hypothetical protein